MVEYERGIIMTIDKDAVMKVIEEAPKQETISVGDYEINVTKLVPIQYAGMIVDNVIAGCFGDDDKYDPIKKDALLQIFVLSVYTDIDMPDDFETAYAFAYHTSVYDLVAQHICQAQLNDIINAIDEQIDYRLSVNTNAVESSLISLQGDIATALAQMKAVYDGINPGDVKALMSAMSGTKLSEAKLVRAITKQSEKQAK